MDKVSDTGLIERLRLIEKSWRTLPVEGIWSRGLTIDRDALCNDLRDASNELAAQKEQYRVLTDEMLVMMDERNAAVAALHVNAGENSRPQD